MRLSPARPGGLGVEIRFTGHGFLKAIGRGTGKSQHEWLKSALRRLMASLVELEDGKKAYAGQLLHHWYRDEETGHHVIELNPKIAAMYGTDGWTQIEWKQRLALKKQPLAQWLHGFYSTHAAPFAYKVETLHRLCGSEADRMDHFREKLRKALDAVAQVTGWAWGIDDADLVQINRQPTGSQTRHLIRQKQRGRHGIAAGYPQARKPRKAWPPLGFPALPRPSIIFFNLYIIGGSGTRRLAGCRR